VYLHISDDEQVSPVSHTPALQEQSWVPGVQEEGMHMLDDEQVSPVSHTPALQEQSWVPGVQGGSGSGQLIGSPTQTGMSMQVLKV